MLHHTLDAAKNPFWFPMRKDAGRLFPGKLERDFLERLIERYTTKAERIVVGPGVGEDATVIDMGDILLVAKTDPITFVTEETGYYAVHVNANDIVCMGATPRWFLATILLPEVTTRISAEAIFSQISDTCKNEGIDFVGGHTEITVGLDRPIVIGQMLGEVERGKLISKRGARENDRILLVKPVPIEGTAIMARERSADLERCFSKEFVRRCRDCLFRPGISIRREAAIAMEAGPTHAMHDPTEGGLFTALYELAKAADLGLFVDPSQIPVLPEGKLLCDHFGIDPFGCISSGSLLVVAPKRGVRGILSAFEKEGIAAAEIGYLVPKEQGNRMIHKGKQMDLPIFRQDEIVKVLARDT